MKPIVEVPPFTIHDLVKVNERICAAIPVATGFVLGPSRCMPARELEVCVKNQDQLVEVLVEALVLLHKKHTATDTTSSGSCAAG